MELVLLTFLRVLLQNSTCIRCWCCCCNCFFFERQWHQHGKSLWTWWPRYLHRARLGLLYCPLFLLLPFFSISSLSIELFNRILLIICCNRRSSCSIWSVNGHAMWMFLSLLLRQVYILMVSLSQQHSVQRYLFVLTNFWNTFDSMLLTCVFSWVHLFVILGVLFFVYGSWGFGNLLVSLSMPM